MKTSSQMIGTIGMIAINLFMWAPNSFGATMSLEAAVKGGKVEMQLQGLGASTGDSILIKIRRTVPETLQLTLEPGTVLNSSSRSTQNMVVAGIQGEEVNSFSYRPSTVITLRDDREHTYVVEAYCLDFHKDNPGTQNSFQLSRVDTRAKKIMALGKKAHLHMNAIQAAIWIDRDKVADSTLKRRFRVDDGQIAQAKDLLLKVE